MTLFFLFLLSCFQHFINNVFHIFHTCIYAKIAFGSYTEKNIAHVLQTQAIFSYVIIVYNLL